MDTVIGYSEDDVEDGKAQGQERQWNLHPHRLVELK